MRNTATLVVLALYAALGLLSVPAHADPAEPLYAFAFPMEEGTGRGVVSPDEKVVYTGHRDGRVRSWDAEQPRFISEIQVFPDAIEHVAIARDGSWLAVTAGRQLARVDLKAEMVVWNVELKAPITALAIRPDDKEITVGVAKQICRINPADGTKAEGKELAGNGPIDSLAWARNSKTLVFGSSGRTHTWSEQDGFHSTCVFHSKSSVYVAVSPDGKTIAVADGTDAIQLIDLATRQPGKKFRQEGGKFSQITWSDSGERLIAAGLQPVVWSVVSGARTHLSKVEGKVLWTYSGNRKSRKDRVVIGSTGSIAPTIYLWHLP